MSAAGYAMGDRALPRSPVSVEELELLKKTLLFDEADVRALRQAKEVIGDQVEAILDVWYGFVGSLPHLAVYFSNRTTGDLDARYLGRVRARFAQWILDTTSADYDQKWLDYQQEIARRHHRPFKNKTDDVDSVDHIHARYILAFIVPLTVTMEPFLAKKGHSADEVRRMQQAWTKAIVLTATLWTQPYMTEGAF